MNIERCISDQTAEMERKMKTYTLVLSGVIPAILAGFELMADSRYGNILFLGEEGRGRRFERVSLDRYNPARVEGGRVFDATLKKIAAGNRNFFVLQSAATPETDVLVRIKTLTSYIRDAHGSWDTVEGNPKTVVSGNGAFGDAGRIGVWYDGIVQMGPMDVLRVQPSRGEPVALWVTQDGKVRSAPWKEYLNQKAVLAFEATQRQKSEPEYQVVHGQMRAYTFANDRVSSGLMIREGATGQVVQLGESGRGREMVELPLVGQGHKVSATDPKMLLECAVVLLDSKIHGLVDSPNVGNGVLMRINTSGPYTQGSIGAVTSLKGSPSFISKGQGAHGGAGGAGVWEDALVVIRDGDALFVRQEGGYKTNGPWVISLRGTEVVVRPWHDWKIADARQNPTKYLGEGHALMGHVPADWIGRVVRVERLARNFILSSGVTRVDLDSVQMGELVRIETNSVVLNLGWDGMDYTEVSVSGDWVRLLSEMQVRKPEVSEVDKRKQVRQTAEALVAEARTILRRAHAEHMTREMRMAFLTMSNFSGFETMPTEGRSSLTSWVSEAQEVVARFLVEEPGMIALSQSQLPSSTEDVTHIWVPGGDGKIVYVLGGKTSKMGRFEVIPAPEGASGSSLSDAPYCFGNPKFSLWFPMNTGVSTRVRNFSSGGKMLSEQTLLVPAGLLKEGVYGVGEDAGGKFFFPVKYHHSGKEVVPEVSEIRKIRLPKVAPIAQSQPQAQPQAQKPADSPPEPVKPVDLGEIDLSGLFGGAARGGRSDKKGR